MVAEPHPQLVRAIETSDGATIQDFAPRVRQKAHIAPENLTRIQDALFAVYQGLPRFRPEKPFVHWLNVVTLNMPALRDRLEDVASLAKHFLDLFKKGE